MTTCIARGFQVLLMIALLVAGSRAHAADSADIDRLKGGGSSVAAAASSDHALITDASNRHDLSRLRGLSPLVGLALLVIALIPLFCGWRFLRVALGLLAGSFAALWTWQYGMPVFNGLSTDADTVRLLHIAGSLAAFVAGFVVGWILYQIQLALAGALLGIMVFSLPGLYLDWPWLTLALMALGAAVGFIVGWVAAPYWAALQTAILGGFMVLQGVAILTQQSSDDLMRLLAYSVAIAAAVVGFICQCVWIARHRPASAPPASAH
ncbi:MAG: hypothetical protein H0W83_18475 [Planctomycetes bacterium]|nr:hypothetical protein [Planctomycetota bacterium]